MSEMKPTPGVIRLFGGHLALVDAEDLPELEKYRWHIANGYAKRCLKREDGKSKSMPMHRQIMKPPLGMFVDHIDGNRLNNTKANLRICTPQQNAKNRKQSAARNGKYKGVRQRGGRFEAAIQRDGRNVHLGSFVTAEDAAYAYDCAAKELHGEFACLNGVIGKPSQKQLAKEARIVLDETGLSPRQLVEMNAELVQALMACANVCAGETTTKSGLVSALGKARAALTKASASSISKGVE